MSQFALPVAELKTALTGLGKVLNTRASLPVLTTIRVERTTEGSITLTSTDLDTFVTVRLEQPTEGEPEAFLVLYEDLQRTVRSCGKEDQILIEATGPSTVTIRYAIGQQFAETKVSTYPAEEFPTVPRIEGESIAIPAALKDSLHQAMDCASTDETRYILNGAYVDLSNKECQNVVGTDGRHLYSSNSFALPLKQSFVLRTHRFLKWKEFNQEGNWQLRVGPGAQEKEAGHLQISTRRWRFVTREIDGNYPNWQQVIPGSDEMKSSFEVEPASVDQVLQTLRRMPSHDQVNFAIGLEITADKVQLLGKSQTAEHWTRVDVPAAKLTGKPVLIFLNRHYLSKALRFGLTQVELIDPMSPLRFSNGGRQIIVMPVRSEAVPPTPTSSSVPEPTNTGAAESVNSGTDQHQPTSIERNQIMVNTTTAAESTSPAPQTSASKIEEALELIDSMRDSLQVGLTSLKDLSGKLKLIQREQKTTEREFQSIRSTLRTLQSVKL